MLASGLRSSLEGPKCIDKVNPTRQQVANNLGLAWYYCGDYANTAGSFLYAASSTTASSSRPSSNLTIDCNGIRDGPDDTGLCDRLYRGPTRSTAFQSRMKADGFPAKDLNPYFHPYVALGDFRDIRRREEYVHFDPQDQVVEPLSIVAVVCNDKLIFGLWADTNNDTVPQPLVGQLSVAMAKMCYGEHAVETQQPLDASDLLFLAFTGTQAVPGYFGADWGAETPEEFEKGLALLGNKLIRKRVFPSQAAPRRKLPLSSALICCVFVAFGLVMQA
ncbi:Endo-chitosanase [Apiospora kogelbergensis]|uniref:Endo-chitosanase n=1 Tax=Apiospora kogelbergensis TaxID=1337665 RepID=UPI00312F59E7